MVPAALSGDTAASVGLLLARRPLLTTRRGAVVAALLSSLAARAQVLTEQDFEAPGSDAVPAWTSVSVTAPDMAFSRAERSAAVGDAGLFLQRPPGGSTGAVQLYQDADARWKDTVFVHLWVRLGPASESGNLIPLQVMGQAIGSAAEFTVNTLADGGLDFGVNASFTPAGTWYGCATRVPFSTDAWHLAEVRAAGMGTDAGWLAGALDGREVCAMRTTWAGSRFLSVRLGNINGGTSTAPLDLDALRVSTVPMASRLELATASDGGACVEVWASAQPTFDGGLVERSYPVTWTVEHDGGARVTACADQSRVLAEAEAGEWILVARVVPQGEATLWVTAPDLLPAHVLLAGPPLEATAAHDLQVGCDCSTGPAGPGLWVVALGWALRRARSRR